MVMESFPILVLANTVITLINLLDGIISVKTFKEEIGNSERRQIFAIFGMVLLVCGIFSTLATDYVKLTSQLRTPERHLVLWPNFLNYFGASSPNNLGRRCLLFFYSFVILSCNIASIVAFGAHYSNRCEIEEWKDELVFKCHHYFRYVVIFCNSVSLLICIELWYLTFGAVISFMRKCFCPKLEEITPPAYEEIYRK